MILKKLSYLASFLIQLLIMLIYVTFDFKEDLAFEVIALVSFAYSTPTLLIHLRHVKRSKVVGITDFGEKLIFKFSGKEIHIEKDAIKEIIRYSWKNMSHPYVFWSQYSFFEIRIEGQEIPRIYSFTKGIRFIEEPYFQVTSVARFWPW